MRARLFANALCAIASGCSSALQDGETKNSATAGNAGTSSTARVVDSDAAFDIFRATKVFHSLDGLRALSIIAVIGFHVVHPPGAIFVHGHLGVQLFFAISGVLITSLLLRERDTAGEISLYNFYVRRSLRIFPLYYAVLMIYIGATALLESGTVRGQTFFTNLPAYLTYTSNWFVTLATGTTTIFYFAWSLATEEQFYLVWPSIVRFSRSRIVPVVSVLIAMLLGEAVRFSAQVGWIARQALPVRALGSIASPICLGCVAAYALHHQRSFRALYYILGRSWSVPVVVPCLIGAVAFSLPPLFVAAIIVSLVVACIVRSRHGLSWLLDNWLVRHIGVVSYGMYLLHMLIYNFARRVIPEAAGRWVMFLSTLSMIIAVASLSFHLFERRVQGLRKRLERRTVRRVTAMRGDPDPKNVPAFSQSAMPGS